MPIILKEHGSTCQLSRICKRTSWRARSAHTFRKPASTSAQSDDSIHHVHRFILTDIRDHSNSKARTTPTAHNQILPRRRAFRNILGPQAAARRGKTLLPLQRPRVLFLIPRACLKSSPRLLALLSFSPPTAPTAANLLEQASELAGGRDSCRRGEAKGEGGAAMRGR